MTQGGQVRPDFANPVLPTPDPALSVFINCPYDEEYEPLLDALVFTTVCCGFHPRTATESEGIDVPRMDRIVHAIFTSNYSIHDLSRYRGEGEDLLARLNMPLELGMVVGRRFVGSVLSGHGRKLLGGRKGRDAKLAADLAALGREHRWLVLVPDDVRYERFVSDLSGYDLKRYDGRVDTIVPRVMSWLLTMNGAVPGLKPPPVLREFKTFLAAKEILKNEWAREVPWTELLAAARRLVPRL